MLQYQTLRPLIFKLDPEVAHNVAQSIARILPKIPFVLPFIANQNCVNANILHQSIDGMDFYNPVGLAAGFDKNATMVETLCALGFSHLELGAVTPKPQIGNPKPRLWRHIYEESIQNAMGFNNMGATHIARRLNAYYPFVLPLGLNIGKNKDTPNAEALQDYIRLAKNFAHNTDYLSINISSPNTPDLRALQNTDFIKELFNQLRPLYSKPIYLKLAPDLAINEALELIEIAIDSGAKGIIATNTTLDYSLVTNPYDKGGISGKVLAPKSRAMLKEIALFLRQKNKQTTLISVGGIMDAQEAYTRIKLGAHLIQIFSGLIFKGPFLASAINQELKALLERDGFTNIAQAVGVDLCN